MRTSFIILFILVIAVVKIQCQDDESLDNQDELFLELLQESLGGLELLLPAISDPGVNMDDVFQYLNDDGQSKQLADSESSSVEDQVIMDTKEPTGEDRRKK